MRHICGPPPKEQLIKAGTYRVEIAFFDEDTGHMGASNRFAHAFIRQHLGLADLIAKPVQKFHDLCKARPARLADLLQLLLQSGIVNIDIIS